ncbi:MAG: hypothetical protein MJY67_03630 [Bacteroidales bacterium]|nr:hypothetical protein [Bacteroidales bacterium]
MRKSILCLLAFFCAASIYAQTPKNCKYVFTEASDLNLIGKVLDNTPNPYHRVDTVKYKGFTKGENNQVRCPVGLAVLFKTDATSISVTTQWGSFIYSSVATMPIAYRGYDLYIKRADKWVWAASGATKPENGGDNLVLIKDMDGSMHECMLYMPNYCEVYSCKIGVEEGKSIEPLESPFKHRIAIFGSSYTHGISTSRSGMSYPMQFMRHTGLQILSLGVSGNCKMQPYFADVLADVQADAYIFDSFSNPDAKMIRERLVPFIDRMISAHPGKPMIFQQTIYREARNFSLSYDKREQDKMDMAASIFKEIKSTPEGQRKYKDVYFIIPNASLNHESSVDGVHPDDYGYYLWSKSIEKPILDILSKYGIEAPEKAKAAAPKAKKGPKINYTEAADLTLVGKLMPGMTPNPYHRVDTVKYKGFTPTENFQVRMTSGMAVAFKTDSKSIHVLTKYGRVSFPTNTNGFAARGYDLYIKKDGKWLWAEAGVCPDKQLDGDLELIKDMDGSMHECLLYFPLYSEEYSIKIGVEEGSTIEAIDNPFRHRVAIWGSSYTHGSSTSRSGMAYPAQFSRATGIQLLSLGCSGNCKLQPYFADVLVDVDAEAFIFDSFSNPDAKMIRERLVPFIDRMVAAHPGKPLIFQQTIYREGRNFSLGVDKKEQDKMDMAAAIFKEIKSTKEGKEKYKDVYFIVPDAVDHKSHDASVDGTHPTNHGYTLWANSIQKPVMKILAKYGIR